MLHYHDPSSILQALKGLLGKPRVGIAGTLYDDVFNLPATNEAPGKHSIVVTEGPIFSEFRCTVGCGQNSHRLTKASGAQKHLVSYNHWLNCKRYCAPATVASQSDEELKRLYCVQVVPLLQYSSQLI